MLNNNLPIRPLGGPDVVDSYFYFGRLKYLLRKWGHELLNSALLFSKLRLSASAISTFSRLQVEHIPEGDPELFTFLNILHDISCSMLLSFKFQMCLENSVSHTPLRLSDALWVA